LGNSSRDIKPSLCRDWLRIPVRHPGLGLASAFWLVRSIAIRPFNQIRKKIAYLPEIKSGRF
jgi:hypothetical protein